MMGMSFNAAIVPSTSWLKMPFAVERPRRTEGWNSLMVSREREDREESRGEQRRAEESGGEQRRAEERERVVL